MAKAIEFEIKIKGDGGKAIRTVTIEATNADEAIERIVTSAGRASDKLREMAERSLVLDTAVRAVGQLRDMVQGLAAPFDSFETAMRTVNTMAGESEEGFDNLTRSVVGLSKTIPMAREELANGLYQVISNGVPEDNWIGFLEKSGKAAVGGLADLGQTVTVTSTIIKNYGLEWEAAGGIQDKIQTTAKNGVTSFEQLASALPRVSGSASQLGVSIDELMAVFATATGVTGNTAEVSTQLAAVFTALVKPSTEAATAADAMGISFDAASVKAAGGLENFLLGLDSVITDYSAKTGELKETIYGNLFGSAESLRLLGSLTGEQSATFTANIQAMADSTGAIDGAFDQMSQTGAANNTMWKNQIQSLIDWAGAAASTAAPYTEMIANTGMAVLSMVQLGGSIGTLAAKLKALSVITLAQAAASKIVAAASAAWKAVQMGLNLVLSGNPIGLLVIAVAALVAGIINAYNNCETFRNICNQVWAVVKELASAVWDFLVAAFERACTVIKEAWKWIKDFFGIDGGASAQSASKAIDKETKSVDTNTKAKRNAAAQSMKTSAAIGWQTQSYKQLGEAIEKQKTKVSELAGVNARQAATEAATLKQMQARYDKLGKTYNLSTPDKKSSEPDGKSLIQNATSYKDLGNNIIYYQDKLERANGTDTKTIKLLSSKIEKLKEAQAAIELTQADGGRSNELTTLSAIDKEIQYQQELRSRATKDNIGNIDTELERLDALKTALEDSSHVAVGIDQITTFEQLEKETGYYEAKLKTANETQRTEIQKNINELKRLRQSWDDTLAALNVPAGISQLDTIAKLDEAISYYSSRQKKASGEAIEQTQREIEKLQAKRDMLTKIALLPTMQNEIGELDGMSGRQLKLELQLIGLDGIKSKIRSLQKMLEDTKNPLDGSQRIEVKKLMDSYTQYENTLKKSGVTFQKAWGSVKGVEGGVAGMTNALSGNADAWHTVTGVVDGVIQLYESMSGIISIIELLTGASAAHAATKGAEAVVEQTEAGVAAGAAAEAVIQSGAVAVALGAESAAWSALAAAKTFAAHAYIPFAGTAIASGFIATQQAVIAAAAIPKFADGGIAYGPTLGIFGEYSGAGNNPEVVAPLDKLKGLIGDRSGGGTASVTFRIKGRDLVGTIANETRLSGKSGKRTNIKI